MWLAQVSCAGIGGFIEKLMSTVSGLDSPVPISHHDLKDDEKIRKHLNQCNFLINGHHKCEDIADYCGWKFNKIRIDLKDLNSKQLEVWEANKDLYEIKN